jgi:hypothetical protein
MDGFRGRVLAEFDGTDVALEFVKTDFCVWKTVDAEVSVCWSSGFARSLREFSKIA